jgi:hypothetical protein
MFTLEFKIWRWTLLLLALAVLSLGLRLCVALQAEADWQTKAAAWSWNAEARLEKLEKPQGNLAGTASETAKSNTRTRGPQP